MQQLQEIIKQVQTRFNYDDVRIILYDDEITIEQYYNCVWLPVLVGVKLTELHTITEQLKQV